MRQLRLMFWSASLLGTVLVMSAGAAAAQSPDLRPYDVVGDAIPMPLTDNPGDPARGRAIVANRQVGLCLLCHAGPFAEEKFQGNLAPDLSGAGSRWTEGQLRLRLVDARRINPATIMPPYYRVDDLTRVAASWSLPPASSRSRHRPVDLALSTSAWRS